MRWNLLALITDRRIARVEDLEQQIAALEAARDEQMDINADIRRAHEDEQRRVRHQYEDDVRKQVNVIESLKLKAATADEELGHLMKIRDEKREIEMERKRVDLVRASDERVAAIRTEYQAKIEAHLEKRIEEQGAMYDELLARLPNIDVALKGRVGG